MRRSALIVAVLCVLLAGGATLPRPVAVQAQAQPKAAKAAPSAFQLKVEGDTVLVVRSFNPPVKITSPNVKGATFFSFPDVVKASKVKNVLTITSAPKGVHRIRATSLSYDKATDEFIEDYAEVDLVVGDVPVPPGPGPGPGPKPPDPPGPVTGLRVVMVRETEDSLTKGQYVVWYSPKVRDYLNAKCKDGAKGWRRYDKDIDTSKEDDTFKQLWKDAKPKLGALPVLVLVSDQRGEIVPLPDSEEAALELLQKWGGK